MPRGIKYRDYQGRVKIFSHAAHNFISSALRAKFIFERVNEKVENNLFIYEFSA